MKAKQFIFEKVDPTQGVPTGTDLPNWNLPDLETNDPSDISPVFDLELDQNETEDQPITEMEDRQEKQQLIEIIMTILPDLERNYLEFATIDELKEMINLARNEPRLDENLKKWFKEKWVRFGPDGKIRGSCARGSESEGKPKCLPQSKAHSLGKKGRASAAARKRRKDPDPERQGSAINVATKEAKLTGPYRPQRTPRQKFNDSLRARGFDPDQAAKRLQQLLARQAEERAELDRRYAELGNNETKQGVDEGGPFSYGAKKPRKGSVADLADQRRRKQERDKAPIEPRNQMVGTAKLTKGVTEGVNDSYPEDFYTKIEQIMNSSSIARDIIGFANRYPEYVEGKQQEIRTIKDYLGYNIPVNPKDPDSVERYRRTKEQARSPEGIKKVEGAIASILGFTKDAMVQARSNPRYFGEIYQVWGDGNFTIAQGNPDAQPDPKRGRTSTVGDNFFAHYTNLKHLRPQGIKRFDDTDNTGGTISMKQGVAEGSKRSDFGAGIGDIHIVYMNGKLERKFKREDDAIRYADNLYGRTGNETIEVQNSEGGVVYSFLDEQQGVAEGKVSGYKMYSNHDGTWYVEDENENVVLRNASEGEAEHAVWSGNQKLKQGVAEGTGDPKFDAIIANIVKGTAARKDVDTLKAQPTKASPEAMLGKFGSELILQLEKLCQNRCGPNRIMQDKPDIEPKLTAMADSNDGGEKVANVLLDLFKIDSGALKEFARAFNQHGDWPWQNFATAWTQGQWADYKSQWTDGYLGSLGKDVTESLSDTIEIDSKQIDTSSIQIGGVDFRDYPDFADAYFEYAEFIDGTPLSNEQMIRLQDEYSDLLNDMAYSSLLGSLTESKQSCPECGGALVEFSQLNEKKDACYYKVKSRYKVWPSAYASGALVQCRKKGSKNWGKKS